MPRKRIIDSDAAKFSVVAGGKNKKILDRLVEKYDFKYSPMMNKIISTFCDMSPTIKPVIESAVMNEYRRLTKELENNHDPFYVNAFKRDLSNCEDILRIMNGGEYDLLDNSEEESPMKKVKLRNGFLIIPKDWIVVNPDDALHSKYAFVMECKNHIKYGVPHFIYLTNENRCSTDMEKHFRELCRIKWNKFKEIEELEKKNKLVADPDNPNEYLNTKEYLAAPIMGFFPIEEQVERLRLDGEEPPFGAIIVRTSDSEE